MALYVMLSSLSESGRKVLRQRPGWIRKVNLELERVGDYAEAIAHEALRLSQIDAPLPLPGNACAPGVRLLMVAGMVGGGTRTEMVVDLPPPETVKLVAPTASPSTI